jgi:hypothetical protein
MFDDVALRLIKLMGHSGAVPGSIDAEAIPLALERLQKAVAADKEGTLRGVDDTPAADADADADAEPKVSLANRALPLIEMLQKAARKGAYIVWDK